MSPAGFKPAIPANEPPQTQALDRTATGITERNIKRHENMRISAKSYESEIRNGNMQCNRQEK